MICISALEGLDRKLYSLKSSLKNSSFLSSVLAKQIQANWGKITPELVISEIIAKTQTGDVHNAVYDLTENDMYVAVAGTARFYS